MSRTMTMVMTQTNNDDSNMPGRYVPGAGAGHGWFQLERCGTDYPTHDILSHALRKWDQDSMLMDYDATTGRGRFVIVDGDAPAPGTEIALEDTITPYEGESLTLTLGAEGIAALRSYHQAHQQLRATGISNSEAWSRSLEHCQREGAQLASWVHKAVLESKPSVPRAPWYKQIPWWRIASYVAAFALVTAIAACFGVVDWTVPGLAVLVALSLAVIGLELHWLRVAFGLAVIWGPLMWGRYVLPFLAGQ